MRWWFSALNCMALPSITLPIGKVRRASVKKLAELEPELVITGHGQAMRGPEMRDALHLLANDFEHIALPDHGRYVTTAER